MSNAWWKSVLHCLFHWYQKLKREDKAHILEIIDGSRSLWQQKIIINLGQPDRLIILEGTVIFLNHLELFLLCLGSRFESKYL